jgi:uncharacterized protein
MKYLVILLVILAVVWLLRSNSRRRGGQPPDAARKPESLPQPQDMVRCPVCSVHLPRSDALAGPDGRMYCCADHRLRAGG